MDNKQLLELAARHANDLLALDEAATSTIYGGLFDAFAADAYAALRNAGLIRSYIPAGCYAPITKLTPKGKRTARHPPRPRITEQQSSGR